MQWGANRGRRIILPHDLDESDVEECAALMNAEKMRDTKATVEVGLSRELTWRIVNEYFMHFGKEHPYGTCFVFASGPEESEVRELTDMLTQYFEPPSDDELIAAAKNAKSVEQQRESLVRLGIGAPTSDDPRYSAQIIRAMHSQDERLREGGLWSAAYTLWPQLLPEIDSMIQSEEEPVLRGQAIALAEHMRQEGIAP